MSQQIEMNTLAGCYEFLIARGYIPVTETLLEWRHQETVINIEYNKTIQKYIFDMSS